jgi:glycosyltransferase involved in cell wall biosynthesis
MKSRYSSGEPVKERTGTILFFVNSPDFFLSHRLPVALAAKELGFSVHVATGPGSSAQRIVDVGLRHHFIPLSRGGINPFSEMKCIFHILFLLLRVKPDLLHLVTIKPVLYGGVLGRLVRTPSVVYAISGLGTLFIGGSAFNFILRLVFGFLVSFAFGHSNSRIIFQNVDDFDALSDVARVPGRNVVFIKGSGVDLRQYVFAPEPTGVPVVTFAGRLLKDKGVLEFVEAAREIRRRGVEVHFWLAGATDAESRSSISPEYLRHLTNEGIITVLGHRSDVPKLLSASNIIVLPSYREGFPKVLIEAAACGRAIVTTDVPGCRDAVHDGDTGVIVPPRDVSALASAIKGLIEDPARRSRMGVNGRSMAEREFSIDRVVDMHLKIYRELRLPF